MRGENDYILMPNGVPSNFQYKEFIKSITALRRGIKNVPKESQWQSIEKLVIFILQPLRTRFGRVRITSGFRSPELCEAIGSSKSSNHTRGEAADIEPLAKNVTLMDILKYTHKNLPHRELIAEYFPDGWVHVAYREGANTETLKLKDEHHNYERVDLEYIVELYTRPGTILL